MTENCLEIENVLKFESLDRGLYGQEGRLWLARLGQPLKSPKFKFSVSGKKKVCLFGVMTNTSVLSDKNVHLRTTYLSHIYIVNTKSNFQTLKLLM